jgi:hypothetical protein
MLHGTTSSTKQYCNHQVESRVQWCDLITIATSSVSPSQGVYGTIISHSNYRCNQHNQRDKPMWGSFPIKIAVNGSRMACQLIIKSSHIPAFEPIDKSMWGSPPISDHHQLLRHSNIRTDRRVYVGLSSEDQTIVSGSRMACQLDQHNLRGGLSTHHQLQYEQ